MNFVNPYTFIALRDGKTLFKDEDPERLTGKIHCRLLTKTQLCIPDLPVMKDDGTPDYNEYGMYRYPFYRINGVPVIPGSSIRGVIRNTYEALTNSCMHINDKESDYFTSRYNKSECGLIRKEGKKYFLYKAERLRATHINDGIEPKTGNVVEFIYKRKDRTDRSIYNKATVTGVEEDSSDVAAVTSCQDSTTYKGYFLRVNSFTARGTHNHPSVFIRKQQVGEIEKDFIIRLKENIERYEGEAQNAYIRAFRKMEEESIMLPVWYERGDAYTGQDGIEHFCYYFAPSQNSRAVFHNKPRDIIRNMGYQACSDISEMCEACALFGFVDTRSNGASIGSRLRFSDAILSEKDEEGNRIIQQVSLNRCILPILGEPRLSSFEFYLRDPLNGRSINPDKDGTVISGRKFYWHHKDRIFENDEKSIERAEEALKAGKTNFASKGCDHELLNPGVYFEFDVFFDKITEKQLEKLVFLLNFGENKAKDGILCHKIGHGKPIGLGSVKVVIDDIMIRDYNSKYITVHKKYNELKDGIDGLRFNTDDYDQLMSVVNINAIQDSNQIMYPCKQLNGEIFKWFADNREWRVNGREAEVKQKLPLLRDLTIGEGICSQALEMTYTGRNDAPAVYKLSSNNSQKKVDYQDLVPVIENTYIGKFIELKKNKKGVVNKLKIQITEGNCRIKPNISVNDFQIPSDIEKTKPSITVKCINDTRDNDGNYGWKLIKIGD